MGFSATLGFSLGLTMELVELWPMSDRCGGLFLWVIGILDGKLSRF